MHRELCIPVKIFKRILQDAFFFVFTATAASFSGYTCASYRLFILTCFWPLANTHVSTPLSLRDTRRLCMMSRYLGALGCPDDTFIRYRYRRIHVHRWLRVPRPQYRNRLYCESTDVVQVCRGRADACRENWQSHSLTWPGR